MKKQTESQPIKMRPGSKTLGLPLNESNLDPAILSSALHVLPYPIIISNTHLSLIYANQQALKLFDLGIIQNDALVNDLISLKPQEIERLVNTGIVEGETQSYLSKIIHSGMAVRVSISQFIPGDGAPLLLFRLDTQHPYNFEILGDNFSNGENDATVIISDIYSMSPITHPDYSMLGTVIDSLPHPFYVIDSETHKPVIQNSAAVKFEASLSAVHCFMTKKPSSCIGSVFGCGLAMVVQTNVPVRIEHEYVYKNGEKRIHEVFGYPVFNKYGKLKLVIQYSIDITERKKSEIEIKEFKEVLDNLMSNLPGMAFRCLNESGWTMEYVSHGCRKLTGYKADEIISNSKMRYGDLIHPDDRQKVWIDVQNAVSRHKVYHIEYRIITRNGIVKWVSEQGRGIFDNAGLLIRLEGLVTDITAGKNAEIRLKSELAVNQAIARTSLELLNENITLSKVSGLIEQHSRKFSFSKFALLISIEDICEHNYSYFKQSKDSTVIEPVSFSINEIGGIRERQFLKQILHSRKVLFFNNNQSSLAIPGYHTKATVYSNLMVVPAFIRNVHTCTIIVGDSNKAYSDDQAEIVQRFVNLYALAVFRQQAESDLQQARLKAEESDQLKSLFLSNMSHEIRTPMNAIIGFAEMLQDRALSVFEKDRYLDVIIKSGDNLLRLINDIIDISKIEAKQIKVVISGFNLGELFDDLGLFFMHELERLDKSYLKLYLPDAEAHEINLKSDQVRLRQIITNLVNNAIKFTDEGFIEIGYRVQQSTLEFYVRDSGIGIPLDQQELIFERFGQVKDIASRNKSGTGLGLTISKNLSELLGGSMWLDSMPGEGSTFWFSIPYNSYPAEMTRSMSAKAIQTDDCNLSGKHILVVEDVDTNYAYIYSLLKKLNAFVVRAGDGAKAISYCREHPEVDLVFMDIELPILDGYEATREIKKFRPDLPIVAQTAYAMQGEREKCLDAGCNEYLSKPLRRDKLLAVVSRFLQH